MSNFISFWGSVLPDIILSVLFILNSITIYILYRRAKITDFWLQKISNMQSTLQNSNSIDELKQVLIEFKNVDERGNDNFISVGKDVNSKLDAIINIMDVFLKKNG